MDVARIDEQLEQLLLLEPIAREARLCEIGRSEPESERALRRLIELTSDAHTDHIQAAIHEPADDIQSAPPDIPGYEIVRELGSGGMARVYEARRDVHGASQTVALKLLRPVLADASTRLRFVREQQILAGLMHPNIAHLVDVGTVGERAYMALELIDGLPIDQHFAAGKANLREVIAAVAELADAIQSAHERLVVHRDIKPGNVLVDSAGTPRLIDFGIAKVLESVAEAGHAATQTGATPMTLRYASPEQLRGEPVGVASDIYQLGLLLFQLLTGAWPYAEESGQIPLQRTRADFTPRRPSDAVSNTALARALKGDIDSIVLRCLASQPESRYRTARELQRDLLRYLAAEPVQARRHTPWYLSQTFARRNRVAVFAAVALLVYAATVTWQSLALREQRNTAERMLARAEATQSFLLEVVGTADPEDAENRGRDLDAVLMTGVQRAESDFHDQPLLAAQMLNDLGSVLLRRSRYFEARDALQRAWKIRLAQLGEGHESTVRSWNEWLTAEEELNAFSVVAEQAPRFADVVVKAFGSTSLPAVVALELKAVVATNANEHLEAARQLKQALDLEAQVVATDQRTLGRISRNELRAELLSRLGNAYSRARRFDLAEPFLREAMEQAKPRWGLNHPKTLDAMQSYAFALRYLKRPEDSRQLFEEVLRRQRELYGHAHRASAYTLGHLANLRSDQKDFAGAAELWRQAELEAQAAMGESHPWVVTARYSRAKTLHRNGDDAAARELLLPIAALPPRDDRIPQQAADLLAEIDANSQEKAAAAADD